MWQIKSDFKVVCLTGEFQANAFLDSDGVLGGGMGWDGVGGAPSGVTDNGGLPRRDEPAVRTVAESAAQPQSANDQCVSIIICVRHRRVDGRAFTRAYIGFQGFSCLAARHFPHIKKDRPVLSPHLPTRVQVNHVIN